ncbi:MAG TPA: hypothetical protein VF494_00935 [Candidatus Limnocylindrales bacterium]
MSGDLSWLPPLMLFGDHGSSWKRYIDALYKVYCDAFVNNKVRFRGGLVTVRWQPPEDGRGYTFNHITTGDEPGVGRVLDFRRCERIAWLKAMLEADESKVRIWETPRGARTHVVVALPDFSFAIYLDRVAGRGTYHLLTAYHIESERKRERMQKEWEAFEKTKTPPLRDGAGTPSTRGR